MNGPAALLAAAATFLGTHFALSHPLRGSLVRTLGEKAFLGVYSLVAFLTFGLMIWAYRETALTTPIWPVGDGLWVGATALMLVASVLLMGSLVRNPALAGTGVDAATASASGVYAVTRHPMMWAFALWGATHILIYPVTKNVILSGAIIILALVGAAMQDRKKAKLDPQAWPVWEERTSYLPFGAILTGRAKLGGFGAHALAGGLVLW
ncbi:NnrU family protein [Sphingomonas sp. UYP23]